MSEHPADIYRRGFRAGWDRPDRVDIPADLVGGDIHIGTVLTGFCGGMFGRESYGDKVIEGLGYDWCVAREADSVYGPNFPVFACTPGQDIREVLR